MKERQIIELKKLMVGFSPDFKENFIKQSTAQQLCNNISMHKKTFENKKK